MQLNRNNRQAVLHLHVVNLKKVPYLRITINAGETASSGESIPGYEYQINDDE